jgi:glycosyltransferase involved in cell wall biosynthesis
MFILRALLVIFSRIFGNVVPRKIIYSTYSDLGEYDLAISFSQDISEKSFAVGCNEFVLSKVKSTTKVTYIHSDFRNYEGDLKKSHSIYSRFDKIACVSNGCKDAFLSVFEDLTSKTTVIYNFVDADEIVQKANQETISYDTNYFNIITVARISKEKGIIRGIEVIRELLLKGYRVKWHIVGDGDLLTEAKLLVENYAIADAIHFYGADVNPYKYMKNADLFMLTSFHEAAPIVFDEAQTLNIPILTTNTISADEMVKARKSGYVCENSKEGLLESLTYILDNRKKLKNFRLNEQNNNSYKIKQFDQLLN